MKLLGSNKGLCINILIVSAGYTRRRKNGDSYNI